MANHHQGPDQRFTQRRRGKERREEMRWEPDKEDRRKTTGRRHDDWQNRLWQS